MGKILVALICTLLLSTITPPLHGFTISPLNWLTVSFNSHTCGQRARANHSCSLPWKQVHVSDDQTRRTDSATTRSSTTELACICIDCAFVTNCTAYHFVEGKHQQPHLTAEPTFTPRRGSPTIHVNIRPPHILQYKTTNLNSVWQQQHQQGSESGSDIHGGKAMDLDLTTAPETTIEYDVVKCADFTLDKGCWVRNMPEEIKRANPDFVPT